MNETQAIIDAYDQANQAGDRCALATIVSVEGSSYRRPGARMLICETGQTTGTISAGCLEADIFEHAKRVLRHNRARLVEYNTSSTSEEEAWGLGLGCGGIIKILVEPLDVAATYVEFLSSSLQNRHAQPQEVVTVYEGPLALGTRSYSREGHAQLSPLLEGEVAKLRQRSVTTANLHFQSEGQPVQAFFEALLPPPSLTIFGAGHDVLPVVQLARQMGWRTHVVDVQARPASVSRFETADALSLARLAEIPGEVPIPPGGLALLMTHHYGHDRELLPYLLDSPARYIGVMGPRKRTARMLTELNRKNALQDERLHAPAGLDIGADTPFAIAVAMVAEMRAVLEGRPGGMLRQRTGSIHSSAPEAVR